MPTAKQPAINNAEIMYLIFIDSPWRSPQRNEVEKRIGPHRFNALFFRRLSS